MSSRMDHAQPGSDGEGMAAAAPLRRDHSQYAMAQKMISKYSKQKDHTLEEVHEAILQDDFKFLNKSKKMNLLQLDKWSTNELLIVKQQYLILHPDGVLIDRTAFIVTGKPVPGNLRHTHFETLHEAVDASDDGQIIVLQEGHHDVGSRPVVLDKKIKIEGKRNPQSVQDPQDLVEKIPDALRQKKPDWTMCDLRYVTEEARVFSDYGNAVFQIVGSGCELCGITVAQRLNYRPKKESLDAKGMLAMCAIDVAGGDCKFEEVHVSTDAGMCIKVHSGSNPFLSKCHIKMSRHEGLYFGTGAKGRVQDCRIYQCAEANLCIESKANPVIFRCRIYGGSSCGVRVSEQGMGELVENQIYGNEKANVRVDDEAEPIFRKNQIYDGQAEGINVLDNGLGVFERNDIFNNASSGVVIVSGADPTLTGNSVHRNRQHGVYVTGGGCGHIQDNEIFQNVLACIFVDGADSNPMVVKNHISNGLGTGITVCDEGEGTIADNDIFLNRLAGIEVRTDGNPTVKSNRIYEGLGVGVRVGKDGKGLFIENQIYRNTHAGVAVEEGGAPRFEGNAIYEGESDGVVCTAYGCGVFVKNKIHKNSLMGVVITREANPTLIGNVVTKNKRCGVQIADRGRGLLEGNRISGNIEAGVRVESKANPLIQKENRIHDGIAEGVLFTDNGGGIMRGNRVFGNTGAGVAIEESAPLVRKNFVYGGVSHGMHIRGGATPRVERNDIFGNRGAGLLVDGEANPLVRKNLFREGKSDGVIVGHTGRGTIEANRMFMNANAGMKVLSSAYPLVIDNDMTHGNGCGLYLVEGGGHFEGNTIEGNYGEQLRVEKKGDDSDLKFVNNGLRWENQASYRGKSLVRQLRAHADPAFLDQPEAEADRYTLQSKVPWGGGGAKMTLPDMGLSGSMSSTGGRRSALDVRSAAQAVRGEESDDDDDFWQVRADRAGTSIAK